MPKPKRSSPEKSGDVAKAIESVSEELSPLYKIEETNEMLGAIAGALSDQCQVIAQYGTESDRATALKYLKRQFDSGTFEEE